MTPPMQSNQQPEPSDSEAELMAMMRFAKDQYALDALRAHVAAATATAIGQIDATYKTVHDDIVDIARATLAATAAGPAAGGAK